MSLRDTLRSLSAIPATDVPFVSVHLNLASVGPGVLTHPVFWKKRFAEELRRLPERSLARVGLERVGARVQRHLDLELPPGARAVAFSIVTHITQFLTQVVIGLVYLIREGLS